MGIGLPVVHEEAAVERSAVMDDRVRVATEAVRLLEQLDVVLGPERVAGTEAGDPGADDRDVHLRPSTRARSASARSRR